MVISPGGLDLNLNVKDLYYLDYLWSESKDGDPRISGVFDKTSFRRHEGRQMLYFVNRCAHEFWREPILKNDFQKLEIALRKIVPDTIYSQEDVKKWIQDNNTKFWGRL